MYSTYTAKSTMAVTIQPKTRRPAAMRLVPKLLEVILFPVVSDWPLKDGAAESHMSGFTCRPP